MNIEIINPLPIALSHYQAQLTSTLRLAGHEVLPSCLEVDIEVGAVSAAAKIRMALLMLFHSLRYRSQADRVLVLWPVFGYWDGFVFRNTVARHATSVIMHDPIPLRRTFGYSVWARDLARCACRLGVSADWIVHSQLAATALLQEGIHVTQVLPHPMLMNQRESEDRSEARWVTVLGQFKTSRDLEMLARLGSCEVSLFGLRILGRGWPHVPGWHLVDRFISEAEFDQAALESAAVVIPYSNFFQSGVAVRCLETLTPILGPDHEFLRQLLGADYIGLISPGIDPCYQLESLTSLTDSGLTALRQRYAQNVASSWRTAWNT